MTARKTDTASVFLVKCFIPKNPFNCCRHINIAVPPMNPVMVECDKKSTNIPSLHHKTTIIIMYNLPKAYYMHIVKLRIQSNSNIYHIYNDIYVKGKLDCCQSQNSFIPKVGCYFFKTFSCTCRSDFFLVLLDLYMCW